jgi:ABC-type branched-subunit amino acid transport system ATPase component
VSETPLLELRDVEASYGPTRVLHGLSLAVEPGAAVAVLGRNGAGKTTAMRTIMGFVVPDRGQVRFDGTDISTVPTHRRAALGIGYVPQGRRLFPRLTVEENLLSGRVGRAGDGAEVFAAIYDAFPKLRERARQKAGTLSGGEQQMVAFGRAVAMQPRLLLLDEPSEGLAPVVVDSLIASLLALQKALGFGIVLVEQNLTVAFEVAPRAVVMERGEVVSSGSERELRDDPELAQVLAI